MGEGDRGLCSFALEAAEIGLWEYDLESGRYFGDERCRRLYGVPERESISAEEARSILHPDDRLQVDRAMAAARDPALGGYYEADFRVIWPDGSLHWLHARGQVTFAEERENSPPVRCTGILIDMTRLKQAEEERRQSENFLTLAVEALRGGYWDMLLDPDHPENIPDSIHLSAGLKKTVGFGADELPDSVAGWHARIHPDDLKLICRRSEAHLQGKTPFYQTEYRFLNKKGEWQWLMSRGRIIRDQEGRALRWIGIDFDLSEKKRVEEALRQSRRVADEASRAKSEFLASMSHEIRTPMTVIMGAIEQMRLDEKDFGHVKLLELASTSADRLMRLVDDLLDIARIEARRLELEQVPFELEDCVRQAVEMVAMRAGEKGVGLRLEVDPEVPARVVGDPDRLGQVLLNLIGNAVKFTDHGEVEVSLHRQGDRTVFCVRDTGIGIPGDQLKSVFETFRQLSGPGRRSNGGSGLGLAISKGLVELMGGSIWAESEPGRGSTFYFSLPLPPVESHETEKESRPLSEDIRQPARILLAEDDPDIRDLITAMLVQHGWAVVPAVNGREAIGKWREGGIDLVLMDVQMPELSGLEATREIRASSGGEALPVIALSAFVRPEDQEMARAAGMNDYLAKPVRMAELYRVVEEHLRH